MPLYVTQELNFSQFLLVEKTIKLYYVDIYWRAAKAFIQFLLIIVVIMFRKTGFARYIIDSSTFIPREFD